MAAPVECANLFVKLYPLSLNSNVLPFLLAYFITSFPICIYPLFENAVKLVPVILKPITALTVVPTV